MMSSGFYRSRSDDDEEELSESVMLLWLSKAPSALPESERLVSFRILTLLEAAENRF